MLLYLDASALVKRYVEEAGSRDVATAIEEATAVATSLFSRAEGAAALAKAVRVGSLSREEAQAAVQILRAEWADFVRVKLTELVVARADQLAWRFGLRGYDAIHLASALLWQETMGEAVRFAAYDRRLWQAGAESGLQPFPEDFPTQIWP